MSTVSTDKLFLASELVIRILLDESPSNPMDVSDYVGDWHNFERRRSILPRKDKNSKWCNTSQGRVDLDNFWQDKLGWPTVSDAIFEFENEDDPQSEDVWQVAKAIWDSCPGDYDLFEVKYNDAAKDAVLKRYIVVGYEYCQDGISWGDFDESSDGVCIFTPDLIKHEWSGDMDAAAKCAESQMKELDSWAKGEVYGFQIVSKATCDCCGNESEEEIDSCWGYYGQEWCKDAALEAVTCFLKDGEKVENIHVEY